MNLWLASYPRSGNTFFRVVLDKVYNIPSIVDFPNKPRLKKIVYQKFPIVKTHLLPRQIVPNNVEIPAVYLVRDGRDSLVSFAHFMRDIEQSDLNFYDTLKNVIVGKSEKYYGGWSNHVREWNKRSSLIIKFEDLIIDPISCLELLRPFIRMKKPKLKNLPIFSDLQDDLSKRMNKSINIPVNSDWNSRRKFFRRGKVGPWKDEMPIDLQRLFWENHGDVMRDLGYTEGEIKYTGAIK